MNDNMLYYPLTQPCQLCVSVCIGNSPMGARHQFHHQIRAGFQKDSDLAPDFSQMLFFPQHLQRDGISGTSNQVPQSVGEIVGDGI